MLIRMLLVVATVVAVSSDTTAQGNRDIRASESIEAVRPIGERRVWRFFAKDSTFGMLTSTISDRVTIDGRRGVSIDETLTIDFSKIGGVQAVNESRRHSVSSEGHYLADEITYLQGETPEKYELTRRGDLLSGYYTRSGREVPVELEIPPGRPAWDNNYVDQIEMILAMRDIKVGQRILDSIFQPQSMSTAPLDGIVSGFVYQEIYKNKFDSVFLIVLSQPFEAQLSFTADKRLIKVNMVNQRYRIYQDEIFIAHRSDQAAEILAPGFSWVGLIAAIPHYVAYLVLAVIALALFMKNGYRWSESYLGFLLGGLVFMLAPLTQIPLQQIVIERIVLPQHTAGGSLYLWGVLPPLTAGIVQTLLLACAIWLVILWRKPKRHRRSIVGAFCGAGFGVVEVVYQLGFRIVPLFSGTLIESGFLILFHVAAGSLLARSYSCGKRTCTGTIISLVIVNSFLRYLPVFVQAGSVEVGVMYFVLGPISLATAVVALLRLREATP
ncbi:MAG: hypothetical protein JSU65_13450 [Candidatus Zixiibacteriota bacterium]|nr:MAG: hypothetical protein JSU65_13450 [candidate division Zixibacteria bacterium]